MKDDLREIAFRVDSSVHIGSGHVMRCLTLADALSAQGARCRFISRTHPGHLLEMIRQRGHDVEVLPQGDPLDDNASPYAHWLGCSWQQDAAHSRAALTPCRPDWLVVDHYALGAPWESAIASHCGKLMVIDDLANRVHHGDLLLDQNLGRSYQDYASKVPPHCTVLTGPGHALLRPAFSALRPASLARRQHAGLQRILVTMGGGDPRDATRRCLAGIRDSLQFSRLKMIDIRITVVLGPQAGSLDLVREMASQMPCSTEVLVNVEHIAELMANSDLAIGAAGSTSWERCCLGLPTLMLVLADNQREAARQLALAGAARQIEVGDELADQLQQALISFVNEPNTLTDMAVRAAAITDGMGTSRVLASMRAIQRQQT